MVKKTNSGGNIGAAGSVKMNLYRNVGLFCGAGNLSLTHGFSLIRLFMSLLARWRPNDQPHRLIYSLL
jgi:hypothetical protein